MNRPSLQIMQLCISHRRPNKLWKLPSRSPETNSHQEMKRRAVLNGRTRTTKFLLSEPFSPEQGQEVCPKLTTCGKCSCFYIMNNTISSSPSLMCELRRLHQVLQKMKVQIQATWIPPAVNRHADRLSRAYNTKDLEATRSLIDTLAQSLQLQTIHRSWPLNESPKAQSKQTKTQFQETWNDRVS